MLCASFITLVLWSSDALAADERRLALVISNSAYTWAPDLANPHNDAGLVARTLEQAGFRVTRVQDARKRDLEEALRVFSHEATGAHDAVVYYAGHGAQIDGRNYAVPPDAKIERDTDLSFVAVPLDALLTSLRGASRLRLAIIDACRNNPFAARGAATAAAGLAVPEISGTMVLFSAKAGTTALDGEGRVSPFAKAVAARFAEPGADVRLIVSHVRDDVVAQTAYLQEPFSYGSLPSAPMQITAGSADPTALAESEVELVLWREALASNDALAVEAYLRRYPNGRFAEAAIQRAHSLRRASALLQAAPLSDVRRFAYEAYFGRRPEKPEGLVMEFPASFSMDVRSVSVAGHSLSEIMPPASMAIVMPVSSASACSQSHAMTAKILRQSLQRFLKEPLFLLYPRMAPDLDPNGWPDRFATTWQLSREELLFSPGDPDRFFKSLGVYYYRVESRDHVRTLDHTSYAYVVGPGGKIIAAFNASLAGPRELQSYGAAILYHVLDNYPYLFDISLIKPARLQGGERGPRLIPAQILQTPSLFEQSLEATRAEVEAMAARQGITPGCTK
jgi:hypothetical protein